MFDNTKKKFGSFFGHQKKTSAEVYAAESADALAAINGLPDSPLRVQLLARLAQVEAEAGNDVPPRPELRKIKKEAEDEAVRFANAPTTSAYVETAQGAHRLLADHRLAVMGKIDQSEAKRRALVGQLRAAGADLTDVKSFHDQIDAIRDPAIKMLTSDFNEDADAIEAAGSNDVAELTALLELKLDTQLAIVSAAVDDLVRDIDLAIANPQFDAQLLEEARCAIAGRGRGRGANRA